MSYNNPQILSLAGMPETDVAAATVLVVLLAAYYADLGRLLGLFGGEA